MSLFELLAGELLAGELDLVLVVLDKLGVDDSAEDIDMVVAVALPEPLLVSARHTAEHVNKHKQDILSSNVTFEF